MLNRILLLLGWALFCANATNARAATWDEHVETIAISPDGERLASAGNDGVIHVWDVASGQQQRAFSAGQNNIYSLDFHPDGERLVSADAEGQIVVWDLRGTAPEHRLAGHGQYAEAAFSPDGSLLVSADYDGLVKIWDAGDFSERGSFTSAAAVHSLAISPDNQRIATGDSKGANVTLWNLDGQQLGQYASVYDNEQTPLVHAVAFRPGSDYVVSSGNGGRLFTHDPGQDDTRLYEMPHAITDMAFSDDGRFLAGALGDEGTVLLMDFAGKTAHLLQAHFFQPKAVAFFPGSHRFATAAFDGAFKVWDAAAAEVVDAFGPNALLNLPLTDATRGVRFADNFDDRRHSWDVRESDGYQAIQHGFYWFEYPDEDGGRFDWVPCEIDQGRDFTIKASIAHISGIDDNGFGIVWGLGDIDNYFSFNVSKNNQYRINKETDAKWENLVEWTPAPEIDRDNSVYVMTIKKIGDTLEFYTNDVKLAELPFEPFFGDHIGVSLWNDQRIAVDWLHVYQEPEGGAR